MASIDGLSSGLDTTTIISQLMQIERAPQTRLARQRLGVLSQASAWGQITVALKALKTAAGKLGGGALSAATATSSVPTQVTATVGAGAPPGTHTLKVSALATAATLRSAGFASPQSVVGAGTFLSVRGLSAATGITASAETSTGAHEIVVTTASAPAALTGKPLPASTTVGLLDNSLSLTVNGTATTLTLASGSYTPAQLAAAVNTGLAGSGATAALDASGALSITTAREGSSATVVVGSGTANSALGLTAGTSAGGTDAQLTVDGTAVTIGKLDGSTVTFGGFTVTGLQHLAPGSAGISVARTTSSTATVADLAAAINSAAPQGAATAVDNGSGSTALVLSGARTGSANALSAYTSGLSGFGAGFAATAGTDAQLTFDGIDVRRADNTIADLVPGVTLNLLTASPTSTVTVTVAKDTSTATAGVKELVSALNSALTTISTNTRSPVGSTTKATLSGDSGARSLSARLLDAVGSSATGATSTPGALGITLQRDGTYAFDEARYAAAASSDPTGTAALVTKRAGALGTRVTDATATSGVAALGSRGATERAAAMQKQVEAMDDRFALTQARLQKQFSALEKALGSLKTQGNWLSGQLAQLS